MAEKFEPQVVFERLKRILQKYEPAMQVQSDGQGNYYLNSPLRDKKGREVFFGAAAVKKNYVSYYLMPVYMFPELLEGISPGLKKRMQGKSCFNFKTVEDEALQELEALTDQGFERFRDAQLL